MACSLILHTASGSCPECDREVLSPSWNKTEAPGCYWCGYVGTIPCSSKCGCIVNGEWCA